MPTVYIEKGILKGIDLEIWDASRLDEFARSESSGELTRIAFYRGELHRTVFRGITFNECSLARTRFVNVTFRRCKFNKVDLTRATFLDCHFSDCTFNNCDPYNPWYGDALDHLPNYKNIAFCFLDGEKEVYERCYEEVVTRMVQGGILVADNAINHQATLQPMLDRVFHDDRVDALIVPIGKGELICRRR